MKGAGAIVGLLFLPALLVGCCGEWIGHGRDFKVRGLPNNQENSRWYSDVRTSDNEAAVVTINCAELVANHADNTFSTSTGWTLDPGWAVTGGVLRGTATSDIARVTGAVTTAVSKGFSLFDVAAVSAGSVKFDFTTGISETSRSAVGRYAEYGPKVQEILRFVGSGFSGDVDNVSVYEFQSSDADSGNLNVIERIEWSYDAAPTGGKLEVVADAGVIYSLDITDAGPGYADFGLDGLHGDRGDGIAVLLHAAGATTGQLHVKAK